MMIAISTKLTLSVLVLSSLIILLVFAPIIYVYREDLNLLAISGLIAALGTVIGSVLFVWKWLRDSLSKKMEHVHENYLFDLYKNLKFYDDNYVNPFFQSADDIKKLRTDLGKYASFLTIKLYPARLLQRMDDFLATHDALDKKVQQSIEMGNEMLGRQCDKWNLLDYLSLGVRAVPLLQEQEKNEYKRIAQAIQNEHQDLIYEMKKILGCLKNLKNLILQELEEFLRCNNLKTEQKW